MTVFKNMMPSDNESDSMMAEFMGKAMGHAREEKRTCLDTAIELTKMALAHSDAPSEDKVFELFERAVEEIDDACGDSLLDL